MGVLLIAFTLFQSTLPQRERHKRTLTIKYRARISIHAPTKGATLCALLCMVFHPISIHAPTKGATLKCPEGQLPRQYFNPRSHKGSDGYLVITETAFNLFQSTLPQRERLPMPRSCLLSRLYFNPRSHKGSDGQAFQCV